MSTPIPKNSAIFSTDELARVVGGTIIGACPSEVNGVITDSRIAQESNLFFALDGERFDAHNFVADVARAGAVSVVRSGRISADDVPRIEVSEPLKALGLTANLHRKRWPGTLIALTGSAGKTTTKELLAAALQAAGKKVHHTQGNLNNLIGVPMTLLGLDQSVDTAVIEVGTSQPGEIAALAAITAPDAALITNVGVAHAEGLGSLQEIAAEKLSLFQGLRDRGIAVINGDQAELKTPSEGGVSKRWTFGRDEHCNVKIVESNIVPKRGTAFIFRVAGETKRGLLQLYGEGPIQSAAAAFALCAALELDLDRVIEGLEGVRAAEGRMQRIDLNEELCVFNDTYNANPISFKVSIETAASIAQAESKALVFAFGDMKELGSFSPEAHREVIAQALKAQPSLIVVCGEEMASAIMHHGDSEVEIARFESSEPAAEFLRRNIAKEQLVLVKGSRSMRMERIVDALCEEGGSTR